MGWSKKGMLLVAMEMRVDQLKIELKECKTIKRSWALTGALNEAERALIAVQVFLKTKKKRKKA